MYFQFANVLVFFLLAFVLCGLMLGLGLLLRPSNPHPGKLTTYECGEPPSGNAWINFNIRFYLIALVFVIFEMEIALIVPVTTLLRDWIACGKVAFVLAVVVLVLASLEVGLVCVKVKGDVEWLKRHLRCSGAA